MKYLFTSKESYSNIFQSVIMIGGGNNWIFFTAVAVAIPTVYFSYQRYQQRRNQKKKIARLQADVLCQISQAQASGKRNNEPKSYSAQQSNQNNHKSLATEDHTTQGGEEQVSVGLAFHLPNPQKHRDYSRIHGPPVGLSSQTSQPSSSRQRRARPAFAAGDEGGGARVSVQFPEEVARARVAAEVAAEERARLRREQDQAFQRSLEEDQIKAAILASQQDEEERAERMVIEESTRLAKLEEDRQADLAHKKALIPPEPAKEEQCCNVLFKVKSDCSQFRLNRRFLSTALTSEMFLFLEAQEQLHSQEFILETAYPRTVLVKEKASAQTFTEAGLCPSCVMNVFVADDDDKKNVVVVDDHNY